MSQILKYYLDQKPLSNSDIEHLKNLKQNLLMNYFLQMIILFSQQIKTEFFRSKFR